MKILRTLATTAAVPVLSVALCLVGVATIGTDRTAGLVAVLLTIAAAVLTFADYLVNAHSTAYADTIRRIDARALLSLDGVEDRAV